VWELFVPCLIGADQPLEVSVLGALPLDIDLPVLGDDLPVDEGVAYGAEGSGLVVERQVFHRVVSLVNERDKTVADMVHILPVLGITAQELLFVERPGDIGARRDDEEEEGIGVEVAHDKADTQEDIGAVHRVADDTVEPARPDPAQGDEYPEAPPEMEHRHRAEDIGEEDDPARDGIGELASRGLLSHERDTGEEGKEGDGLVPEIGLDTPVIDADEDKGEHQDILHDEGDLDEVKPPLLPCGIAAPRAVEGEVDEDIDIDPKLPVFGDVGINGFHCFPYPEAACRSH